MSETEDGRPRLLVADDDAEVRDILREFLGRDYDCAAVGSAEEALALLGAGRFNLVVSDIAMPGMSGLELAAHVRAVAPGTVVVVISGTQTLEAAVAALRAGAFDYVVKPFELGHVETAVRRALEHQGLLAAKLRYERDLQEMIRRRTRELDGALRSVERSYRMTLEALTAALETRDAETRGHSERVVNFSLRLGREMGLDREQLRSLEFGSLLHDIGKIGVPDAILRKPAALTEAEWMKMREHPRHGARILRGIEFLEGAARVVAQHHEKWDGTGYPSGLRGDEIDLNARIFAVADAFDAITSDRVYRRGRSYEEAARELDRCAGTHFDPTVVAAFRRVPPGEWDELRRSSPHEEPAGESHAEAGQAARAPELQEATGERPHVRAA
ncbi:MAG: response regulator [Acidobacteriota bacterium]|nr:response regulator [Acidobacteriota bacterium]